MARRERRPRRFPLIRLGLLVVVGSLFASVLRFYMGVAESFSSMSGETRSTAPKDLARWFVSDFLFAGTTAGALFWVGLALCAAGVLRRMAGMGGRGQPR